MVKEKWIKYGNKADYNEIGKKYNISPVVAKIMSNRGVTEDSFERFLNGGLNDLYSPFLMKDMEKGVNIIIQKISENKKIRVVGDYDIDGICSSYILSEGIKNAGGDVSVDIPDRVKDGYGINENIINKAGAEGIDTIITCDNGIAAIEAAELAKKLGMTVIVTDHHEVPYEEINGEKKYIRVCADATINPKQPDCAYPFKMLCGGGIALKFIMALYDRMNITELNATDYIEYAAIATIGDIVDLKEENRIITRVGLERLRHTKNTGLNMLIKKCEINKSAISAYHIGFIIGPCLNASGRLETAKLGLELLKCNNEEQAEGMALNIKELNDKRKAITELGVKSAIEEAKAYEQDKILVIYLENIHESVAGIVAGRIKELYNKPTIILTNSEEKDIVKGSGRSIAAYNMYEGLTKAKELLLRFGGHEMAAGITLKKENLEKLRNVLNGQCGLTEEDLVRKVCIDVQLRTGDITFSLANQLKILEPFGKGNEKPVLGISRAKVRKITITGKNSNVVKLKLCDDSGVNVEGILFNKTEEFKEHFTNKCGEEEFLKAIAGKENNITISCICYPDINEYNGMKNIQIIINNYC